MNQRHSKIALGAVLLATVTAGTAAWQMQPVRDVHVAATEAFDLNKAANAAAWADDVFVAEVTSGPKYHSISGDLPVTVWNAKVLDVSKGRVTKTIHIAQSGGLDSAKKERIIVEGVTPLEEGHTYLFVTRASSRGWHMVPTGRQPVEIIGSPSTALADFKKEASREKVSPDLEQFPSEVVASQNDDTIYQKAQA